MSTNPRHHLLPLATLAATAASTLLLVTSAHAQQPQASFALNDGAGTPDVGSYAAGASFTLAVTFTSTVPTPGYSLWFDTATANTPYFSIGTFTLTSASAFPSAISGGGAQAFNTANAGRPGFLSNLNDLGATTADGSSVAAGSYLVENVSFLIDPATPAGTYTLQTTPAASGGRASGGSDAAFNFSAAPSALYTINVVPEPSSWALVLAAGATAGGALTLRRRRDLRA